MRKLSAQFARMEHTMSYRVPVKRDYAAALVRFLAWVSLPLATLCGALILAFSPHDMRTLSRWVFGFSSLGVLLSMLVKKPNHTLWAFAPLRTARHATRIVWSGFLSCLASVSALLIGVALYRSLFIRTLTPLDALMAWGAILLGQAVFGFQMLHGVRGKRHLFFAATGYVLLFLGLSVL